MKIKTKENIFSIEVKNIYSSIYRYIEIEAGSALNAVMMTSSHQDTIKLE